MNLFNLLDALSDHLDNVQTIYYRHRDTWLRQTERQWRRLKTRPRLYVFCYLDRKIVENAKRNAP